jgi:hypothetical protein
MRAIMVAVDYADLLAITLPYNRHHFDQVCIVTDGKSYNGVRRVVDSLPGGNDQNYIFVTESFYAKGATFNKWRALEDGLDWMGREGWICIMDADVLWPRNVNLCTCPCHSGIAGMIHFTACCKPGEALRRGKLYSPLRRMLEDTSHKFHHPISPYTGEATGIPLHLHFPPESQWDQYPIHRNVGEWAGYTQIFHADDPVLGPAPWHETDWKHAGGADSFFQAKWKKEDKVRPDFEVLHLGPAGMNWCGRATEFVGGGKPIDADRNLSVLKQFMHGRRLQTGPEKFQHEKLDQ